MQDRLLKRIFTLTAKKEIIWSKLESKTINCNIYEGEGEKHKFKIFEFTNEDDSFVGYWEKEKEKIIVIEASQKDIDMFIKIIKATKIKERVLA